MKLIRSSTKLLKIFKDIGFTRSQPVHHHKLPYFSYAKCLKSPEHEFGFKLDFWLPYRLKFL